MRYFDLVAYNIAKLPDEKQTRSSLREALCLDVKYPNNLVPQFELHKLVTLSGMTPAAAAREVVGEDAAASLRQVYVKNLKRAVADARARGVADPETHNPFLGRFGNWMSSNEK